MGVLDNRAWRIQQKMYITIEAWIEVVHARSGNYMHNGIGQIGKEGISELVTRLGEILKDEEVDIS